MMRNIISFAFLVLVVMTGCVGKRDAATHIDACPDIFPDYKSVTIPVNIAPMNFMVEGAQHIQARFLVDGNEVLFVSGEDGVIDIPEDDWHGMAVKCAGKSIGVEVSVWNDKYPDGVRYKPFDITVSNDSIDPWIAYRLIEPGYEAWRYMGIYQRKLCSFDEEEIITNKTTKSACVNCHHFDQRSAKRMMFHARGANGGTIFLDNGKTRKVKPEMSVVYPAWHPQGRYIAFSSNVTRQTFYGEGRQIIEVFDLSSDLILYDTKNDKILKDPRFLTEETMETFPAWSPDGKWLYFSAAPKKEMPEDRKNLHYSIIRVDFDAAKGQLGDKVNTVYNARIDGGSASFPRISPDGRYLLFTLAGFGTFPIWHNEADLKMLDLTTGTPVDINVWNDADNTESYHSWSNNGRWVMFASRRLDGRYTRVFFAHLDKDGKPGKPFLLPQRDPRHNIERLKSYNIPEFVDSRVEMPASTVELFRCADKLIK